MPAAPPGGGVAPEGGDKKKTVAAKKPRLPKPNLIMIILLVAAVGLAIFVSFQPDGNGQPRGGLIWLFQVKQPAGSGLIEDVGKVLAPLLALALAIERVIETIFDLFEQSIDNVADLGSGTSKAVDWLNQELGGAWKSYEDALKTIDATSQASEADLKKLESAKNRISEASSQIEGLKKDPKYISAKRALSIWLGLSLGLIVAVVSDEGIFEYLNMGVPRIADMLITGFIIGAGSGPMHSLVGILQGGKDALAGFSERAGGGILKKELESLKQEVQALKKD
jgi:hypothetical protein